MLPVPLFSWQNHQGKRSKQSRTSIAPLPLPAAAATGIREAPRAPLPWLTLRGGGNRRDDQHQPGKGRCAARSVSAGVGAAAPAPGGGSPRPAPPRLPAAPSATWRSRPTAPRPPPRERGPGTPGKAGSTALSRDGTGRAGRELPLPERDRESSAAAAAALKFHSVTALRINAQLAEPGAGSRRESAVEQPRSRREAGAPAPPAGTAPAF